MVENNKKETKAEKIERIEANLKLKTEQLEELLEGKRLNEAQSKVKKQILTFMSNHNNLNGEKPEYYSMQEFANLQLELDKIGFEIYTYQNRATIEKNKMFITGIENEIKSLKKELK